MCKVMGGGVGWGGGGAFSLLVVLLFQDLNELKTESERSNEHSTP